MTRVAVFDFDNTLIEGDSFMPFLSYACGPFRAYGGVLEALALYGWRRIQNKPAEDLRTFVKDYLLHRLLKGMTREAVHAAAVRTRLWQKINEPVLRALTGHRLDGDTIVIASGSLDLYLDELLVNIPHDAVICTDVRLHDGVITGDMANGNCVRLRKAERVAAWLKENGPFEETFGYGNYPHDVPMLNEVKHRIIVS